MSDWYYKAMLELEKDLDEGVITDSEFRKHMRDLNGELRECAEQAADQAFHDVMSY